MILRRRRLPSASDFIDLSDEEDEEELGSVQTQGLFHTRSLIHSGRETGPPLLIMNTLNNFTSLPATSTSSSLATVAPEPPPTHHEELTQEAPVITTSPPAIEQSTPEKTHSPTIATPSVSRSTLSESRKQRVSSKKSVPSKPFSITLPSNSKSVVSIPTIYGTKQYKVTFTPNIAPKATGFLMVSPTAVRLTSWGRSLVASVTPQSFAVSNKLTEFDLVPHQKLIMKGFITVQIIEQINRFKRTATDAFLDDSEPDSKRLRRDEHDKQQEKDTNLIQPNGNAVSDSQQFRDPEVPVPRKRSNSRTQSNPRKPKTIRLPSLLDDDAPIKPVRKQDSLKKAKKPSEDPQQPTQVAHMDRKKRKPISKSDGQDKGSDPLQTEVQTKPTRSARSEKASQQQKSQTEQPQTQVRVKIEDEETSDKQPEFKTSTQLREPQFHKLDEYIMQICGQSKDDALILDDHRQGYAFVLDTNCLINSTFICEQLMKHENCTVIIPFVVLTELDKLKDRFREARFWNQEFNSIMGQHINGKQTSARIRFEDGSEVRKSSALLTTASTRPSNDDKIIASCIFFQEHPDLIPLNTLSRVEKYVQTGRKVPRKVFLVTGDFNMANRAYVQKVEVIMFSTLERFIPRSK